jgi:hypothetical protein
MTDDALRDLLEDGVPEPPRALQLPEVVRAGRTRVLRRRMIALSAVLALAGGGLFAWSQDRPPIVTTPLTTTPLACPTAFEHEGFVPSRPTAEGSDGRMAPLEQPIHAVVCRYRPTAGKEAALLDEVVLPSTAGMAEDLQVPPIVPGEGHACTLMDGPSKPLLLGLTYPSGTVWVSVDGDVNGCHGSTNGVFSSNTGLSSELSASADAGSWTAPPINFCRGREGRLGQERELVPAGVVRFRICHPNDSVTEVTDPAKVRRAAELVNGPTAAPSGGGCSGPSTRTLDLRAEYATGRSVALYVADHCTPNVMTSSLQAVLGAGALDELFTLLSP